MDAVDDLTARVVALEFFVAVTRSGHNPTTNRLVARFRSELAVQFPDADPEFLKACEMHLRRAYDLRPDFDLL